MYTMIPTIVRFLLSDATVSGLVSDQIASKHLYGTGWTPGSNSIVISATGSGDQSIYLPVNNDRIVVTVFSSSLDTALNIFEEVRKLLRDVNRERVVFPDASVKYLYFAVPASTPVTGWNPDLNMDFVLGYFKTMGYEEGVA